MITGVGTGQFTGTISATGYLDQNITGTITQGNITNLGDIYLTPSAIITGTVQTSSGGAAANAFVELADQNNNTVSGTLTGSDGSFTINTEVPTGTYSIFAFPGFNIFGFTSYTGTDAASAIMTGINATEGQTTSGITLNLLPGGTISGQVTDNSGNGVANVTVSASNINDDRYANMATTDATGHYTITGNLVTGTYNVTIPYFFGITGYVFNTSAIQTVSVTTGSTTTANFQLQQSGSISGSVTYANGAPAANISVFAFSTTYGYFGSATTKNDGTYLINSGLGTDSYTVMAASDYFAAQTVTVTAGSLTPNVNFNISYNPAWITGTVSNSTGPLYYAAVGGSYDTPNTFLPGQNTTTSSGAYTGSDGTYLMEIQVFGSWSSVAVNVTAAATGYSYSSQPATATAGQTTSGVNFVLAPTPTGSVEGRVVSNTAPPAPLTQVTSLSVSPSSSIISVGSPLTLTGTLTPSNQSGTVTIYESINGSAATALGTATLTGGTYSYSVTPSSAGTYQFYATWPGNSQYSASQSSTINVNVTSVPLTTATLSMSASSTSLAANSSLTLSGSLTPSRSGTVTIYESINSSASSVLTTQTLSGGAYSYSFTPSVAGTYQFYTTWPGDSNTTSATSSTVSVSVTAPTSGAAPDYTLYGIIIVVIVIIIAIIYAIWRMMQPKPKPTPTPKLSIQASSQNVVTNSPLTISGAISPMRSETTRMAAIITIYQSINGSGFTVLAAPTLTNGAYSHTLNPSTAGTYQFYATWAGDSQTTPQVKSSTISVSVTQAPGTGQPKKP